MVFYLTGCVGSSYLDYGRLDNIALPYLRGIHDFDLVADQSLYRGNESLLTSESLCALDVLRYDEVILVNFSL